MQPLPHCLRRIQFAPAFSQGLIIKNPDNCCQRAVSRPISTIMTPSSAHLREKTVYGSFNIFYDVIFSLLDKLCDQHNGHPLSRV